MKASGVSGCVQGGGSLGASPGSSCGGGEARRGQACLFTHCYPSFGVRFFTLFCDTGNPKKLLKATGHSSEDRCQAPLGFPSDEFNVAAAAFV